MKIHPVLEQFHEATNRHDAKAVMDCIHPKYELYEHGELSASGPDEVHARLLGLLRIAPDFHQRLDDRVVDGNRIVESWTATGTHRGEFLGIAASGRPFEFRGVSHVEVRDDKMYRVSQVWDRLSLLKQIT